MGDMADWITDNNILNLLEGEEEMEKHTFFIAGVQHHQYREALQEIQEGDQLEMVPEPTNKFDPNAIRLHYTKLSDGREVMLGYVPAKKSPEISALLQVSEETTCTITRFTKSAKPWEMFEVEIVGE